MTFCQGREETPSFFVLLFGLIHSNLSTPARRIGLRWRATRAPLRVLYRWEGPRFECGAFPFLFFSFPSHLVTHKAINSFFIFKRLIFLWADAVSATRHPFAASGLTPSPMIESRSTRRPQNTTNGASRFEPIAQSLESEDRRARRLSYLFRPLLSVRIPSPFYPRKAYRRPVCGPPPM